MPRGELVGDAYIRITADTTAMRRALKREAALAEQEGASAGGGYTSAFGKEVEAHADQDLKGARDKIRKALTSALVSGDFSEFEKALGGVEPAAARLREELNKLRETNQLNAREFEVFTNQVDKWAKSAAIEERAKADADALRKLHDEALDLNKVWDTNARAQKKAFADMQAEAIRMNRTYDMQAKERKSADAKAWADMVTLAKQMNATFDRLNRERTAASKKAWGDMVAEAKRMNAEFDRGQRASAAAQKKAFADMRAEAIRMNKAFDASVFDEKLRDAALEAARFNAEMQKKGKPFEEAQVSVQKLRQGLTGVDALEFKKIRRLAGDIKGAGTEANRMEVIFHNMDKSLQGFSRRGGPLIDILAAPLRAAAGAGAAVEKLFPAGGGGGLTGGIVTFVGSIAAAGAAIGVLLISLSLLASALSLLAGMITIVVVGLGTALTGAALVAAAAIPAVTAAVGGLLVAFKGFSDAYPKVAESFKKFGTDAANALRKAAFKDIGKQVDDLLKVLRPLAGPLMTGIGKALHDSFQLFVDMMKSPQMRDTLGIFVKELPKQVALLGKIFVDTFGGLLNFFGVLQPFVTRFLTGVSDMASTFRKWTGSAEGKNTIAAFMERAFTAASTLWDILKNVATAIGGIFSAGSKDGQGFLQWLSDITKKFSDFVNSPEGQNSIREWLGEARDAAEKLGGAIGALSILFDKLDTTEGRESVTKMIDSFDKLVIAMGKVDGAFKTVETVFANLDKLGTERGKESPSGFLSDIGGMFVDGAAQMGNGVKDFVKEAESGQRDVEQSMSGWDIVGAIGGGISDFLAELDRQFFEGLDQIKDGLGGFFTDIGFQFGEGWGQIVEGVGGFFSDIGTQFMEGLGQIGEGVGGFFSDIGEQFMEGIEQIGEFFSDLPNKIAYWLGAATGGIATFFKEQWDAVFDDFETAVIPFFTGLPTKISDAIIGAGNWIQGWFQAGYDNIIAFFENTIIPFFVSVPGKIADGIIAAGNWIQGWFQAGYDNIVAFFEKTIIPFFVAIPGRIAGGITSAGDWIQGWFQKGYDAIISFFEKTIIPWFTGIPGRFTESLTGGGEGGNSILQWFQDMWNGFTSWWERTAQPWLAGLPARALVAFTGLAANIGKGVAAFLKTVINDLIGQINSFIRGFNDFSPFGDIPTIRYLARGGLVDHPTMAMVGEAGREAVVPLDRPLSQVDESVRWLAAIAQGKTSYASGGVAGGKSLNIAPGAISVTVPNSDPVQVASAVLDRVAVGVFV